MKKAPKKKAQSKPANYGASKSRKPKQVLNSSKKVSQVSNKPQSQLWQKLQTYVRKLNPLLLFWLILGVSALSLYLFNARRAETFAENTLLEVQFDHQIQRNALDSELAENNIVVTNKEVVSGNYLAIRTNQPLSETEKFTTTTKNKAGVLSSTAFSTSSYSPLALYLPGLINTIIAAGVLAFALLYYALKSEPLLNRLRAWAIFMSSALLPSIALAALGVILSKLKLVYFVTETFNIYLVLNVSWVLILVYIFCKAELRQKYLDYFTVLSVGRARR